METPKKDNRGRRKLADPKQQISVMVKKSRVEFLNKLYIQEKVNQLIEELYIAKGGPDV